MNTSLAVVIGITAALLGIVGSLIILNLRAIKTGQNKFVERVEKQDARIEKTQNKVSDVGREFAECKVDCERNFVNSELFLRETGYTRRSIESLSQSVNRIEGTLLVVEKLPQIYGDISREIAKEMKNGGKNG